MKAMASGPFPYPFCGSHTHPINHAPQFSARARRFSIWRSVLFQYSVALHSPVSTIILSPSPRPPPGHNHHQSMTGRGRPSEADAADMDAGVERRSPPPLTEEAQVRGPRARSRVVASIGFSRRRSTFRCARPAGGRTAQSAVGPVPPCAHLIWASTGFREFHRRPVPWLPRRPAVSVVVFSIRY